MLLTLCVGGAVAQTNELYISGSDTLSYQYRPIDQTSDTLMKRGRPGRWLDRYLGGIPLGKEHNVKVSLVGGPAYSTETSLRLTLIGTMDYRTKHHTADTFPSTLKLSASASISGYYHIAISGHNSLKNNRHRLFYRTEVTSLPTRIWGLDYDSSLHGRQGSYVSKLYTALFRYNYALVKGLYIGVSADYRYNAARKPDSDAISILTGRNMTLSTAGLGINITYDSRDDISAPHRGIYLSIEGIARPAPLNNVGHNLWQANLTFDAYQPLWRGAVLAFDLYAEHHSADTPWLLRSQLGDEHRMRGYYAGRFNGNNLITTQLELRQHIWYRIGCVLWGGVGTTFSEDDRFAWRKVLPNYGIGLRWALRERSNIRLDFGFGRDSFGVVVGINEAF